jgi:CTP synthase
MSDESTSGTAASTKMKYIVVTGGVVSGLGKGVTISSMGRLLQACGYRVTAIKIDPYLNVDAGTMSPFEHGEVFVLNDGGESDLDLGNYERFLSVTLTSNHNITTGKIYRKVITAERRGDYLGRTVQVVPHITDCIQDWIETVARVPPTTDDPRMADICLIEVGGTVGDIESSVFLEALRQFQFRVGHDHFCLCFVSLVPVLSGEEQKTKPTQHGVRDLRSLGLQPQIIFGRSNEPLAPSTKQKISSFCHVPVHAVLSVHDVNNVYQVPGLLESQNLHQILHEALHLSPAPRPVPDLSAWNEMARTVESCSTDTSVTIALIGKYTGLQDSYLSVIKALRHACVACRVRLDLQWVEASLLEKDYDHDPSVMDPAAAVAAAWETIHRADGVIVPGGFGKRGWEGMIATAQYCREHGKPYLGICLGFQAQVVEYCRHVLHWPAADSAEFYPPPQEEALTHPVVIFMPEIDKTTMGGTMRLGIRTTRFTHAHVDGTVPTLQLLYGGKNTIDERHRHRYEINPEYVDTIHEGGLLFVGRGEVDDDANGDPRMEIAELPRDQHPYYVGCQFHPEFLSRPLQPSPPFHGLILAATGNLTDYLDSIGTSDD